MVGLGKSTNPYMKNNKLKQKDWEHGQVVKGLPSKIKDLSSITSTTTTTKKKKTC
jgi:hypothetical protein